MDEVLRGLRTGDTVLDLGCSGGSFKAQATRANVVRVDREFPVNREAESAYVQADAAHLPFREHCFAAVVSNHSLEHFDDAEGALREMGRVLAPDGALYVAVPDASTLTDKLYRWLSRGGGHVNAYTSATETRETIERATGMPHVATRLLCSSLSFLNRRNAPRPLPRRLSLLGGGHEWSLFLFGWLSRRIDRRWHTRLSVYGWAFYFGAVAEPVETRTWLNVCVRCGSGCSSAFLMDRGLAASNAWRAPVWRCPQCGARNPFADDPEN